MDDYNLRKNLGDEMRLDSHRQTEREALQTYLAEGGRIFYTVMAPGSELSNVIPLLSNIKLTVFVISLFPF